MKLSNLLDVGSNIIQTFTTNEKETTRPQSKTVPIENTVSANGWLDSIFRLMQSQSQTGERAGAINKELLERELPPFIPQNIAMGGNSEAVEQYLTKSIGDYYNGLITNIRSKNSSTLELVRNATTLTPKQKEARIKELEKELNKQVKDLETKRDTLSSAAQKRFQDFYKKAYSDAGKDTQSSNLSETQRKSTATERAVEHWNRFVFAGNTELSKVADEVTPFATGKDDSQQVELNDIKQSGLGDCYFLATLGALAKQHPEMIEQMIHPNDDGTYTVTLHEKDPDKPGSFRDAPITVDATFPSDKKYRADLSGDKDGQKQEVWTLLVEKAYAKLRGSYGLIGKGGLPEDAMETLTGRDARFWQSRNYFKTEDMTKDLQDKKAVVLSTSQKLEKLPEKLKEQMTKYNLYYEHAYTVSEIMTDEKGRKTVLLYNPWGKEHPKPIPYNELKDIFPLVWRN